MIRLTELRRQCGRLLTIALVVAGTATAASPAAAEPDEAASPPAGAEPTEKVPGGFPSWRALFAEQSKLNAVADRIIEAGGKLSDNGFAGVVAAPEDHALVLYWRGAVPASVRSTFATAAASVPVHVKAARYSRDEVKAAAERIMASSSAKTSSVTSVSVNHDGSGMTVTAIDGVLDRFAATAVADTPVAVTVRSTKGRAVPTSRQDDSPPYWGGALWYGSAGNCTTGFAVSRQNGARAMLTAAHCASSGEYVIDGGGQVMGRTTDRWPSLDSMLIDVNSNPSMYDGEWNSNWAKVVVGVSGMYNGNWMCTSGAASGVLCSMRVVEDYTGYTNNLGWWVYPAFHVTKVGGGPVTGAGDSGGPVFTLAAGAYEVNAAGISQSGEWGTDTWCAGLQYRGCYSGMYGVAVRNSTFQMGLTVALW